MSGVTPVYSIPYPTDVDLVADIPDYMQDMAEQIESTIAGLGGVASPGSWVAPTLLVGSNYGSGFAAVKYRKIGVTVYLRGLLGGLTISAGTTLFALPVGFRPLAHEVFLPMGETATISARVDVQSGGNVVCQTAIASANFLSLSGISFATD